MIMLDQFDGPRKMLPSSNWMATTCPLPVLFGTSTIRDFSSIVAPSKDKILVRTDEKAGWKELQAVIRYSTR